MLPVLLALIGGVLAEEPPLGPSPLVIRDVRLVDPETGTALEGQDVYLEGGRIAGVGPELSVPEGTSELPGGARSLVFALTDSHTHLEGIARPPWALKTGDLGQAREAFAQAGVLRVVDLGGPEGPLRCDTDPKHATTAAHATGSCGLRGTEVLATGKRLSPPGGHLEAVFVGLGRTVIPVFGGAIGRSLTRSQVRRVRSPEHARAQTARTLEATGSTVLKIDIEAEPGDAVGMPEAELRAIVEEAHARGARVVAHVGAPEDVDLALRTGVDVLAHVPNTARMDPELVARVAESELAVISTLTLPATYTAMIEGRWAADELDRRLWNSEDIALVEGEAGLRWRDTDPDFVAWVEELALEAAAGNLQALHEAGVPVLAGTDSVIPGVLPGASLHRELGMLVDLAGFTPAEALAAATVVPARVWGLEPHRWEVGAPADLLLVDGDPLQDVGVLSEGVCIIEDGWLLDTPRCASVQGPDGR